MATLADPRQLTPKLPVAKLFIDNQWVAPVLGGTWPVVNPATGQKLFDAPAASAADVDAAVRSARRAFDDGPWPRLNPSARAKLIRRFAELLNERRDELALLECLNNGKTFKQAVFGDVGAGAATMAWYSEWPTRILGEVLPVDGPFHAYTLREPVGVVAAIVPWNYPTSLATWKLGPAFAAGCCVVLKPSELTPLTALKLGEIALDAGFPPGVLNVLPGTGDVAGEALARHPMVDKVSFTGSVRTARKLLHASADTNLKRLSLELGGKSPQLVFADADLDAAVDACVWGIFGNKGEVCNAGSRVLVHERVYEGFVGRLVERSSSLKVGDPLDPATEMGAQVSLAHLEAVLGHVATGREQGATLLLGGERDARGANARGAFLQPTIFGEVLPSMRLAQEEIFGPVLSCLRFEGDEQAVTIANGTSYGLAAAVWTADSAKAQALAKRLRSGVVWLNCFNEFDDVAPFGGYKESGWGRDLGAHALEQYTQVKTVWTKLP